MDKNENNLYIIELDEGLYNNQYGGYKKKSNGIIKAIAFGGLAVFYLIMLALSNFFDIKIMLYVTFIAFLFALVICFSKNKKAALYGQFQSV